MGKITLKNKNGIIKVINKLSYPEMINEYVYKIEKMNKYSGILPIDVVIKGKCTIIQCNVYGMIGIQQYFAESVSKRDFISMLRLFIDNLKKLERDKINIDNLELDEKYVFINSKTREINCILWPVVNNKRENSPKEFLRKLVLLNESLSKENESFIKEYINYVEGNLPFSINGFSKMLDLALENKKSVEIEHRKEAKDRIQDKNDIEYNPLTIIHSNKESVEKTMDNKLIACLTNIKKGTRSFIEGDCYEIGTDIENDLCLTGKFISRNHAKIIVENGKYYLIDCNSKNGTFINSVRIPVGNPVEIFNNSEIYFADECFIFTVER